MRPAFRRTAILLLSAIVVAGIVFVASDPGPLPTLPTPPGVVAPEGMRYVGGDEFDAPDGSAPDATKWKISADPNPTNKEAVHEHGLLRLSPKGYKGRNSVSVWWKGEVDGTRPGRVEFRIRLSADAAERRRARDKRGSGHGWQLGSFDFQSDSFTGGPFVTLFGAGYDNDTPKLKEDGAMHSFADGKTAAYDGDFHTHALEWHGSHLDYFRDGKSYDCAQLVSWLQPPVFSYRTLKFLTWLPDSLPGELAGLRQAFTLPNRFHIICADAPPIDTADPLCVEIDYVRIFQE